MNFFEFGVVEFITQRFQIYRVFKLFKECQFSAGESSVNASCNF